MPPSEATIALSGADLVLTIDGHQVRIGTGPHAGATIRDWLLILADKTPKDEAAGFKFRLTDSLGVPIDLFRPKYEPPLTRVMTLDDI